MGIAAVLRSAPVGPITTQPSSMEKQGAIYENAAILNSAGVNIARQTELYQQFLQE